MDVIVHYSPAAEHPAAQGRTSTTVRRAAAPNHRLLAEAWPADATPDYSGRDGPVGSRRIVGACTLTAKKLITVRALDETSPRAGTTSTSTSRVEAQVAAGSTSGSSPSPPRPAGGARGHGWSSPPFLPDEPTVDIHC